MLKLLKGTGAILVQYRGAHLGAEVRDPRDGLEPYEVGDAVSSRDIHCAILDPRRLCRAL